MATLTIELSADAERRLREEAARRNASAEELASRLLVDQLRFPIPAELDVIEKELDVIHQAVSSVRANRSSK